MLVPTNKLRELYDYGDMGLRLDAELDLWEALGLTKVVAFYETPIIAIAKTMLQKQGADEVVYKALVDARTEVSCYVPRGEENILIISAFIPQEAIEDAYTGLMHEREKATSDLQWEGLGQ